MKKMNPNIVIGIGLIMLITSITLLIYGYTNAKEVAKVMIHISRFLALISVIGVWYFGWYNTKQLSEVISTQNNQIEKLKKHDTLLEGKVKPENREREDITLKLNRFISLLDKGYPSYSLQQEIRALFQINKLEPEYYDLIKKLYEAIYKNETLRYDALRRQFAWKILAEYPDLIDIDFFLILIDKELTQIVYGDPSESAMKKNITKAIEYIHSNEEDFRTQANFISVDVFFRHIAKTEEISKHTVNIQPIIKKGEEIRT